MSSTSSTKFASWDDVTEGLHLFWTYPEVDFTFDLISMDLDLIPWLKSNWPRGQVSVLLKSSSTLFSKRSVRVLFSSWYSWCPRVTALEPRSCLSFPHKSGRAHTSDPWPWCAWFSDPDLAQRSLNYNLPQKKGNFRKGVFLFLEECLSGCWPMQRKFSEKNCAFLVKKNVSFRV